ncbi:hypothetical protein GOODEAATRI_026649 [Goodea atripinnis]|uniref:Uncharacterized protein n=1 Tax=Goodea atripinnis TaxID=208336 RepID=A0ABV0MVD2_9TELE
MKLSCGSVPMCCGGGGDSWCLGSGACVRYLCPGWGWPSEEIHVRFIGGGGLMVLESEVIGSWDYFILWRLWLVGLFGPYRPLFCTWPPPQMRMGVVGDWGPGLGLSQAQASPDQVQALGRSACLHPGKEGDHLLGPGAGCPYGVLAPGPGGIEYVWGV